MAGGVVMGLALGVRHVQGLFLLPITSEKGWSRELFALAMAVQNLTWGVVQPVTGIVADRFGSAKVVAAGLVLYAFGLHGMATATTPTGFVLASGVCIGVALSGTAFGVIYATVSRLVASERRASAMGVAGAIGGLGQFFMVPATQELIGTLGWRSSLAIFALVTATLLPLAVPLQERWKDAVDPYADAAPDQRVTEVVREAFSHSGFWLLNLGFMACGFQVAFIGTHLPAYLMDKGMTPRDGVGALATIALANIIGIYFCGRLGGRFRQKYLLSGLYLARTAVIALFLVFPLSRTSMYLFSGAMGLLWLGVVPLTNGVLSRIFGVRNLSTLFGFVFLGHQLGSFLGIWLGGYVFDTTRSYDTVWSIAMALGVLSCFVHWPIDDRQVLRDTPKLALA
ncbi:MAG: MFS transporter [Pseudomonadota bacterium]